MRNTIKYALSATAFAMLVACGGGGDGEDTAQVPVTYDLGAALRTLTSTGQNSTFTVAASNGCVGSGSNTISGATTSTTFEGKQALSSTSVWIINYTNCTPRTTTSTTTNYFDTSLAPLGAAGDRYLVYSTPLNLPGTVKVGDAAIIGTATVYSNSTKTTQEGTVQLSYVVEADTANTALVSVVTRSFNSSNVLQTTQLTKYRLNTQNTLSLVSLTIQYSNGVNVVFTKN